MPFFDGADGRVYYKAWQAAPPRQAAVVFLHGFGEHSGLYHRLGNTLTAAGIDLWALDEIGHGLSDGERAVIKSMDDLAHNGGLLTELAAAAGAAGDPLFLAGHSLGAAAAAVIAGRDPAPYRGFVLSGAPLSPLDWVTDLLAADSEEGGAGGLALDPADLSADPFYLDELENDPLAFTSAAGAQSLHSILPPAWAELGTSLASLTKPVLLIHGEQDPVVPHATYCQLVRSISTLKGAVALTTPLNTSASRYRSLAASSTCVYTTGLPERFSDSVLLRNLDITPAGQHGYRQWRH